MFRFSPIKLWRNISIILFLVAIIFTLIGTFAINDNLVIHWNDVGVPNNSTGKWILWVMLLLAFISMFTHSSFSKKGPGRNPMSLEMAGAISSGLVSMWTVIDVILVIYNFCTLIVIPITGTIVIVFCYILFVLIAYGRNRKADSNL